MPFEFGPRLNVSSNFSRAHYPFISVFRFYHRSSSLGRLCREACTRQPPRASGSAPSGIGADPDGRHTVALASV
jgi:hypothetical protein